MLTVVMLVAFVFLMSWASGFASHYVSYGPLAAALPWMGSIGAGMISWFLFPGIMPVIVNFFDSEILGLIERHSYPQSGAPIALPFKSELWHDAKFSIFTIALNIIVLPLYLLPLGIFIFYAVNGYLLGREFFMMTARRHMPLAAAEALRKRHGRATFFAGTALAIMATIPIVNLVAPFWGIAAMAHLYHSLAKEEA
jgi:CysZ protein